MFFDDISLEKELIFQRKIARFTEHDMHTHDALEIGVLQENDVRYRLLDQDLYGKPGDVFIFRPFEPHWTLTKDEDKPARWIMVLFSPAIARSIPDGHRLLTPFYTTDLFSPLIPADSNDAQKIQQAASQAVLDQEQKPPGWQATQYMFFIEILISIFRYYTERHQDLGHIDIPNQGIVRSIEYILQHLFEELDMEHIIHLSQLKKTWFYKQFKQVTGVTPNDFIHRLRLQYAIYLLNHTQKTITDIAFECGFQSLSTFHKQFKRYRNISPREHRKRMITNV